MIYLVCEKSLEEYEKKIIAIGRRHTVLNTEFCKAGGYYWMRLDCED